MERKNTISALQLFALMILCNIIVGITYNLPMSKSKSIWDHTISAIIAIFVNLIFIFTNYKLYKTNPEISIVDNCKLQFNKIGSIFLIIYGLYYLFAVCYTLSLFNIFVKDVVNPDISGFMLTLCLVLGASYAAVKGIEGIARAGTIILFIIISAIIFIIFTLIPQIDIMNYSPIFFDGFNDTINGSIYIISLTFYIPLSSIIIPFAKGNIKKTLISTVMITYLSLIFIIIIVTGALGDYLKSQNFPLYAATTVAEIGVFKKLDAIYLGIFTTGIFITTSLFLFAFFVVMKKLFVRLRNKIIVILGNLLVLVISLTLPRIKNISYFFYNTNFILLFTALTSFIIPIIIIIKHQMQKKQGEYIKI